MHDSDYPFTRKSVKSALEEERTYVPLRLAPSRRAVTGRQATRIVSDLQNFRHSASVAYSPIRHWESGDRMVLFIRHSPSIH
eukprot:6186046-Pleurochrysis_carterae.AAC.1